MRASDYAELYAVEDDLWWFEGMRAVTAALLDPVCAPGSDRMILDAGCGTGANLSWLARYAGAGRVVGIDAVATALRYCRQRGRRDLAQGSVTALPFAPHTFHLVTSFDVLSHLPAPGADERAIQEFHRVLRPGGIVFIRVAAHEWMRSDHDAALGTHRRYSLEDLTMKTQRAGLRVVRATYANGLLLPMAALQRHVLKRIGLGAGGSDVKPLPPAVRWLSRPFTWALRAEARLLRRPGVKLRAGLSAICIAERAPR